MTRWRRIPAAIAASLLVLLTAAIITVAAGVTIDVSRWRSAAAEQATAALGRPVVLEGPIELRLGWEILFSLGGVRILNPSGFTGQEFFTLGDVRARFDLLDALRGRLPVRSVEGRDSRLQLERAADGRANWIFAPVPTAEMSAPRIAVELGDITLHNVAIEYYDARSARRHAFAFDEISGRGSWDEALRLALRGHAGNQSPYTLTVDGGPARLLREATTPWPFTLDFEGLATRLHASGEVDAASGEARFHFGAGTEDLAQVQQLLDTRLPRFGVAALCGTGIAAADSIELADLRGTLGESELSGRLALALGGARPRVSGELSLATLALHPFLGANADEPPGHDERERQSWPLRDLVPVDVDVDLRVGRWLRIPVDVRDTRIALHVDARGVRAPIGATLANVPFFGHLDLDTAAPMPTLAVQLDAKDAALGDLARVLTDATGIEGTLGRLSLRAGGRGETLGALARDLELTLAAGAARLRYGRSIPFTLDALDVAVRPGGPLRGRARGTLQAERATLSFRGGTLPDMLREHATPVELDLVAAHAKLRVEGTLALPDEARGTDLAFSLDARRSGDLARFLGFAPASNLPLALRGRVRIASDAWQLDETTLRLGRSALAIEAHRSTLGGKPITLAAVRSPLIDVPELATLRPSKAARGKPGPRMDLPLIPRGIDLGDADIGLGVERVALGRIDLLDVGFAARIREGRLSPSPVAAKLAGAPVRGLVALDPRGDVPDASLELSTGAIDIGALLRGLGVAEGIDGQADALQLQLQARGGTLRELAEHSSFEARVIGGSVTLPGAAARPLPEIGLDRASVSASASQPIRVRLDGTLDETPVTVEVASGTLIDFVRDATRVPFSLAANAAGAHLTLDGEVTLPLGRGGQLTLEISGERLDTLNGPARVELPPWGPWSIRGPIRMTPTGYEVQGLLARVGENRLYGTGRLDVTGPRPRLDVRLTAPSIQLDNFPLPERVTDDPMLPLTVEGVRATARSAARKTERLLSAGFLRRLDATLDVEVQEVLSGSDRLADGLLRIQVLDGRLYLGPAQVNLSGGALKLSIAYDPTASEVALNAGAYIERFDYGILARRLGRADDVRGLLSLDLELAGKGPSLDAIMLHADGRLDFAIWPENLRGGIFNMWSVNLLLTVLPLIDPGGESHINCLVGRFDLKDGILSDDKILIDTTRVRVRGAGSANLATEKLAFVFRPRAKGLALFRLQTPLRVTGTLTDYRIGIERRDLVVSTLRMLASPIILPLDRLILGPLPRDGADVCTDPLRE